MVAISCPSTRPAVALATAVWLVVWALPALAAAGTAEDRGIAVHPAPQPPATALAAWHSRYVPRAAPVKQAMAKLLAARQEVDPTRYKRRYRDSCRLLDRAVAAFDSAAREQDLYPRADAAAAFHLRRAYAALARAGTAGAGGHFESAEIALAESVRWFRQATVALERYGLEP
ncbi:MAG TPA: hypothetical protein VM617_08975 [Thermoanaerobaculia bacterium]|nr:hypothetical protein [Thermoanaerobaculia bacterium]